MTVQSFKHLPIDNPVSIHHGKICSLATRLYRAKNNLSFKIIVELFERRNVIYNALSDFSVTLFRIGFFFLLSKYLCFKETASTSFADIKITMQISISPYNQNRKFLVQKFRCQQNSSNMSRGLDIS